MPASNSLARFESERDLKINKIKSESLRSLNLFHPTCNVVIKQLFSGFWYLWLLDQHSTRLDPVRWSNDTALFQFSDDACRTARTRIAAGAASTRYTRPALLRKFTARIGLINSSSSNCGESLIVTPGMPQLVNSF